MKANYTIKRGVHTITVTGSNGEFTHDYSQHSTRTKAYRIFIAKVLKAYGTHAVEDILWYENH